MTGEREVPKGERGGAGTGPEDAAARRIRVLAGLYPLQNPWRVGRKTGRTIYAQFGPEASDDDPLIGMMDTQSLARRAVAAHNAGLIPRSPGLVSGEEGEDG